MHFCAGSSEHNTLVYVDHFYLSDEGYSNLRKHCRNSRIGYSFYAIKDTAMITKLSSAIASSFRHHFPAVDRLQI